MGIRRRFVSYSLMTTTFLSRFRIFTAGRKQQVEAFQDSLAANFKENFEEVDFEKVSIGEVFVR